MFYVETEWGHLAHHPRQMSFRDVAVVAIANGNRVPELVRYNLHRQSGFQPAGRAAMPQRVKREGGEPGSNTGLPHRTCLLARLPRLQTIGDSASWNFPA